MVSGTGSAAAREHAAEMEERAEALAADNEEIRETADRLASIEREREQLLAKMARIAPGYSLQRQPASGSAPAPGATGGRRRSAIHTKAAYTKYVEDIKELNLGPYKCDKLTDRNGSSWRVAFEQKLTSMGLWHILFERESVPEDKHASLNQAAISALFDSLSPSYQIIVQGMDDVADMYEHILDYIQANNKDLGDQAERDLANLQWESKETSIQFTTKILDIRNRLREAARNDSDLQLKSRVYAALPHGWGSWKSNLYSARDDPSVNLFRFLIALRGVSSEMAKELAGSGQRALSVSTGGDGERGDKYCSYCKRHGHTVEDCRRKKGGGFKKGNDNSKSGGRGFRGTCWGCGKVGHIRAERPQEAGTTNDDDNREGGDKLAMAAHVQQGMYSSRQRENAAHDARPRTAFRLQAAAALGAAHGDRWRRYQAGDHRNREDAGQVQHAQRREYGDRVP